MAKRAIDIVGGAVLLVLATPLIFLSALIVMVSLRTFSPFFIHERVGRDGVLMSFTKLRTLPRSTPVYGLKTQMSFDEVPWVLRFMRRLHIDELPQLALVLSGKVSLVGPRPKMPDDVEPVPKHYGKVRVTVPQGCTGLWQITEHKAKLPSDSPEYDLFYVDHHSTRFDLWILWRTVAHGLRLRPLLTSLDEVPHWACPHGAIDECGAQARDAAAILS